MAEKMNKNFRTSIVYVFWKKVDGLLRNDVEMIQNIARKRLTRTQTARTDANTPKQKEKHDGRKIRNTVVWRSVREKPFGIDKTVRFLASRTRVRWESERRTEDGWYQGRKRRFSFLGSPAKRYNNYIRPNFAQEIK